MNPWFFVYFNNIYFMNVECIMVHIVKMMVLDFGGAIGGGVAGGVVEEVLT